MPKQSDADKHQKKENITTQPSDDFLEEKVKKINIPIEITGKTKLITHGAYFLVGIGTGALMEFIFGEQQQYFLGATVVGGFAGYKARLGTVLDNLVTGATGATGYIAGVTMIKSIKYII